MTHRALRWNRTAIRGVPVGCKSTPLLSIECNTVQDRAASKYYAFAVKVTRLKSKQCCKRAAWGVSEFISGPWIKLSEVVNERFP